MRDALAAGATQTGSTIHIVDAGVDTGPVISQRSVNVTPGITEAELHEQIKEIEREHLVSIVREIAEGKLELERFGR
ncbi:MAG: hypothetical protein RLZ96_69 [Actinomycetota bacterium]